MPTEDFSFSKFASNPFYRNQNARLIDLAELRAGQRIVDLACGTGGATRLISERLRGARDSVIIGIDHSAGALRQAMDDLKDIHAAALQFVQSQVEQVSESITESVDTVFFCNAIHYVSNKGELLADISKTLKPGGQLAFNTSFFDGAHPPETVLFARKWMLRALRTLRRDYGISPVKSAKVESRKQLTPDEYRDLVEGNGFKITKQRIAFWPASNPRFYRSLDGLACGFSWPLLPLSPYHRSIVLVWGHGTGTQAEAPQGK